jgi:serine/threonine protein kinase
VAVKIYDKSKLKNPIKMDNVFNEIDILYDVNNHYIVKFVEKFETQDSIQVVMEYGGLKNLRDYVEQERVTTIPEIEDIDNADDPIIPICIGLDSQIAINVYKQIVKAIYHLHSKSIVHRDIKLENIVIDDAGKMNIKLVDFGFARKDHGQPIRTDICGTPNYMPPELHKREPHLSKPADIWASGVIFFYLLTGFFPFGGKDEKELSHSICTEDPFFEILGVA